MDPEWAYYDEDYSSVLSKTIEWRDSVFRDFKENWLKEYLLSLRKKDRASYCHCPPRVWKGEGLQAGESRNDERRLTPLTEHNSS